MAVLRMRSSEEEIELEYDDDTLAKVLVMVDESISRRSGIWLNLLVPDADDRPDPFLTSYERPHRMVWVPASGIDIEARFDGETPLQARALAVLGSGPPDRTQSELAP